MATNLSIKVYLTSQSFRNEKVIFARELFIDGSLAIDFNGLISSFKFLFGSDCVIDFNISSYDCKK